MTVQESLKEKIFDYDLWTGRLDQLRPQYRQASPFPHIVLDNFLNEPALDQALAEFPALHSGSWVNYLHVNENKYGKTRIEEFSPALRAVVDELNSPAFVKFLTGLTGIDHIFADTALEGGGLHQSAAGGFLNIHADFTVHPHHRDWQRRINVLVYLNKNWREEYNGHLELWDKKMTACVQKVAPLFNRAVIFNTTHDAFHGHPEPLRCPTGVTRKSIALYYFSRENNPRIQSTEYRARPGDGFKAWLIRADKWVVRAYDAVKRKAGFDDRVVSKVLSKLQKLTRRTPKQNP